MNTTTAQTNLMLNTFVDVERKEEVMTTKISELSVDNFLVVIKWTNKELTNVTLKKTNSHILMHFNQLTIDNIIELRDLLSATLVELGREDIK